MNLAACISTFGTAFGWRKSALDQQLTIRDELRGNQLRLLIFSDEFGPTVQINWIKPLQAARASGGCALWLIEENRLEAALAGFLKKAVKKRIDRLVVKMRPDAIVVCRYGGKAAGRILKVARRRRIPLIFHIDDNLLSVPKEMGKSKHRKYSAPTRQKAFRLLLTRADLVYCSTPELLRQFLALSLYPRCSFVGQIAAGADSVAAQPSDTAPPNQLTIGYMGSSSHNEDLELVCPVLEQILDEMPHVRFEVFGSVKVPNRLGGRIAHRHEPIPNYDAFLRRLATLQWHIGIAPLRLTSFNLAKTNAKWVEYAAAGIPVVSSRHPVYSKIAAGSGLIEAEGHAEWYSALSNLILDEGSRQSLRCHAMALLERKYSVRHLTVQVAAVLSAVGLSQRTGILCQCQNDIDRSQG